MTKTYYDAAYAAPPLFSDYLDRRETATFLNIHQRSVERLQRDGHLRGVKAFGVWMFDRTYLETWRSRYDPNPGRKTWPDGVTA